MPRVEFSDEQYHQHIAAIETECKELQAKIDAREEGEFGEVSGDQRNICVNFFVPVKQTVAEDEDEDYDEDYVLDPTRD